MDTGLYIARRYLFAKKSHNVINVISAISAAGMAIGTAALILILSIYNGFDRIIEDNMSDLQADILVTRADGRRFIPEGEGLDSLYGMAQIRSVSEILEDNVAISYGDRQGIARAKGVDAVFEETSPLAGHVTAGVFSLHDAEMPVASMGVGLAHEMGINPRFLEKMTMYYPRSGPYIPLTGPMSSLNSVKISVSSLFSINSTTDSELIVLPIGTLRTLLGAGEAVSGLELRTHGPADKSLVKSIGDLLGEDFKVQDRYMQNPAIYKMMKYEKLAIYAILIFVVIIIAFNIFGSLSMLIIEKRDDMQTLRAMGAGEGLVKRIFLLEGWMISLVGLAAGLVSGIVLALLQQHFGIVKMPDGFFISAYPAVLRFADVLWTAAGVALTGFMISFLSVCGRK